MSKVSVAVIGLNGALGEPTIEAFQSAVFKDKFAFPVLAVTRNPASKQSSDTIKYVGADLAANTDDVIKQLKGIDVIVSLLNPSPDVVAAIEQVVLSVKPKLYIPSQFGCVISEVDTILPGFLGFKTQHSQKVRDSGVKVVVIANAFFAGGPWLHEIVGHVGIDAEKKSVTYLGSPDTKFSFTTLNDVGRVIASVASKANEHLPHTIRVQSGKITPSQVVKRYEETHHVKLDPKQVIEKDEALKQARAIWDPTDFTKLLYWLNVALSQGEGYGIVFNTDQNELVNPGESLWKWEKF